MARLDIRQDDRDPTQMVLLLNGQLVAYLPWRIADEVASKIRGVARKCEEYEKANSIILADAALIRSGAPFSLTSNPRIREESFKEAQWDSAVRKAMPLRGVPSPKACGTPTLIKHQKIGGNEHG